VVLGDVELALRLRLNLDLRGQGAELQASASHGLIRLSLDAAERGLSGLEYASGIPGSVGGALHMNAGAHGRELVTSWPATGSSPPTGSWWRRLRSPGNSATGAVSWAAAGGARAHRAPGRRRSGADPRPHGGLSQPTHGQPPQGRRNAGCIFKNPPGENAGRLIELAGLKGFRVGPAEVSLEHALPGQPRRRHPGPVRRADGGGADRVRAVHGIDLEPEVEIWSSTAPDNPLI